MRLEHLGRTENLLELHRQAIEAKLIDRGEASQLDFIAYAERALAHARRPGAMFVWFLKNKQTKFITQIDEDRAMERLRDFRRQEESRPVKRDSPAQGRERELSEDERVLVVCIQAARQHRIEDPFRLAWSAKGWTRDRWNQVKAAYDQAEQGDAQSGAGGGWSRIVRADILGSP